MTTPAAHAELRPVGEVEPIVLEGIRVFRHVVAHGEDLLRLGSLDNTRWVECDLSHTVWPRRIHEVTFVDCDLRNSVWDLDEGENIKIFGSKRIKVAVQ